jgi:putative transcriptional regulator
MKNAKITKVSRWTQELLQTADDLRASGLLEDTVHEKITMRHKAGVRPARTVTFTGKEIKSLREKYHLSQAVFASYLNLTQGYVSQLERGAKRPNGPALILLDVIRHKGPDAILVWRSSPTSPCRARPKTRKIDPRGGKPASEGP